MLDDLRTTSVVLERDEALPQVPRHPAPWRLEASAYLLAMRMPQEILDRHSFVAPSLAGKRCGDISFFMYVDYRSSNCGPYQELIFVPGMYDFGEARHLTIARIYVSTYDSVVNGRLNWGIPKDRADFTRKRDGKIDHVQVSRDGHVFADMRLSPYSLPAPVAAWLLPRGLRTFVQHWQGKSYRYTLSGTGMARLGRVVDWRFDPKYFPDLALGKVIGGVYLPRVSITFPVATVHEGLV